MSRESRVESRESSGRVADAASLPTSHDSRLSTLDSIQARLAVRHRAERRFRLYGQCALGFAVVMLCVLLLAIIRPGIGGFTRHELRLDLPVEALKAAQAQAQPNAAFYAVTMGGLKQGIAENLADSATRHQLYVLAGSFAAHAVRQQVTEHPEWLAGNGTIAVWVPMADNADQLLKGRIKRDAEPALRPISDLQLRWIDQWSTEGRIRRSLNTDFFTRGDSRAPEAAGFLGSVVGSIFTLICCLALAIPIALMAAITLEEFARKTRFATMLEIVINNLAAVPSIIYGLLGLSVFLQLFSMPRSSALVGGLTLSLLIMPVMIIAARSAIRAVPPSMRQAATALGATPLQVVRHHVLPYALPGIMTGTILSICRALGETAPLLMIGMVAFVADIPRGVSDPATTMPVAVYLWASSAEVGFVEKTSTGILILLVILLLLNLGAIKLRNTSQKTWQ